MAATVSRSIGWGWQHCPTTRKLARQITGESGGFRLVELRVHELRTHRRFSHQHSQGSLVKWAEPRGARNTSFGCRCSSSSDESASSPTSKSSLSPSAFQGETSQGAPRKERKREPHRHVERLGPRRRAKMMAGHSSRLWKKYRRKAAKMAESIGEAVDVAAAAVALPTLAPLSSEAAHAFSLAGMQGPSDSPFTDEPLETSSPPQAPGSALAAFLALDQSRHTSGEQAFFFTSPQHFPASQALRLEGLSPLNPSQGENGQPMGQAAKRAEGWREAAQMVLPVLGLAAATVAGALCTRRAVAPRVLPTLAMRALAYPALFLQTGILTAEQGAERARQAALWSLPPALVVSSCFMGWRVAAASAAAFLTAELVNVNVSERMPRASQWWKVVLVAAAAASVVDALIFTRFSSGAARGLALAMAVTGDFGDVGSQRSASTARPAIKKQKAIEMEGQVSKALPNAMFQVALDNGCQVLAHISGKIRRNRIEIFQGDRVKVEISPYDLTRGRITHRNRRQGQGPAPGSPAPPGSGPAPTPAPANNLNT